MKSSRAGTRGKAGASKSIREAAGSYAGAVLVFETDGDRLVVRKVARGLGDHLQHLSDTMSEWASAEDEEAWRDL